MTYYFIMYTWKRSGALRWEYSEFLTETHPVEWLVDIRRDRSEDTNHGTPCYYDYSLIGWKEASKEIYDVYKDEVG